MESKLCPGCLEAADRFPCPHCGYPNGSLNHAHQLPVGSLLRGQYLIGKALGQGGFGITYLAWDRYLDMKVAIKEFYPSALVNRDSTHSTNVLCTSESLTASYCASRDRFLREAKALAKFDGIPAIVGIKGFFEENNTAYIVMEYVKGTSLDRYIALRGGRITPQETFRLLQPVMDALAKIHEAGMVHRDISPDNIILHPLGGAKLLDFGAVREVEDPNADRALARSTEAILKHGFAPLEQYQSRGSLGPWTDVYALCSTIWYCVTGQVPTDAPARVLDDIPLDWDSVPGLTERQRQVLRKGTAMRAKDRYAAVGQLCAELLAADTPAPIAPAASVPKAAPEPSAPKVPAASGPKTVPEAPAPKTSGSGDWFCGCGYRNKSWHASCQSCGTRRAVEAPPKPRTTPSGDWFCGCGYRNKSWHASCQSCGTRKGEHEEPKASKSLSDHWYCSCGQKNKGWHASCQNCGAYRP